MSGLFFVAGQQLFFFPSLYLSVSFFLSCFEREELVKVVEGMEGLTWERLVDDGNGHGVIIIRY